MKKTMFRRFAAVLLTLLMALSTLVPAFAADAKAIPGTVTTQVNAGFVNVTSEYIALNALRREPFVSQLNADNFTRTFYNTTVFDQLPVLMYNERTALLHRVPEDARPRRKHRLRAELCDRSHAGVRRSGQALLRTGTPPQHAEPELQRGRLRLLQSRQLLLLGPVLWQSLTLPKNDPASSGHATACPGFFGQIQKILLQLSAVVQKTRTTLSKS